jgi:hypothetical protein
MTGRRTASLLRRCSSETQRDLTGLMWQRRPAAVRVRCAPGHGTLLCRYYAAGERSIGATAFCLGKAASTRSLTLLVTLLLRVLSFHAEADPPKANATIEPAAAALPFDREVINRYSLDHLPRSLSIRQGKDVWLGYDLERAKIYKVWQAREGKPGLLTSGFVTKSAGTSWYEDKSTESWQLQRAGTTLPLSIRYEGCSQRDGSFELRWELRHGSGRLTLRQRVAIATASAIEQLSCELRVESLAEGEALLLPAPARNAWKLTRADGSAARALGGAEWHRITLLAKP